MTHHDPSLRSTKAQTVCEHASCHPLQVLAFCLYLESLLAGRLCVRAALIPSEASDVALSRIAMSSPLAASVLPCPDRQTCNGNAAEHCASVPKLCGRCCNCDTHSRRKQRGGRSKRYASADARRRAVMVLQSHFLNNIMLSMLSTWGSWLQANGCGTWRQLK